MQVYLPAVYNKINLVEALIRLILNSSWQQREDPYADPILVRAAQNKADDMAKRDYFSHVDPDGGTVNEYIRAAGYRLPDYYPQKGNNCESIVIGASTPEGAIEAWLNSPSHRIHLQGEIDFYRSQRAIGVGMSKAKDGRTIFVFISAPPMEQ